RALGEVRDLDVLVGNARKFRETLPQEQQADMDGLLDEWLDRRKQARKRLIEMLGSKQYSRFTKDMDAFLNESEPDEAGRHAEFEPYQVRHTAGSAIWSRYETVRAFETVAEAPTIEQLHALRIKGKYLRYTLECFRETLPPEAAGLIRDVVKM